MSQEWVEIKPPEGFNSLSLQLGEFVAASKTDGPNRTWSVLHRKADGTLERFGGVWNQFRVPAELTDADIKQALGWAESEIAKRG